MINEEPRIVETPSKIDPTGTMSEMWKQIAYSATQTERERCAQIAESCIRDISLASDIDAEMVIANHNEIAEGIAAAIRSGT